MDTPSTRPELAALALSDPPGRWEALGFVLQEGCVWLGGVCLALGHPGHGIVAWSVRGGEGDIDGLPTTAAPAPPPEPARHPNGAFAIDHVVVATPDFDRTAAALDAAAMPLRRQARRFDGARMGFRRLGPAILELIEAPPGRHAGPAIFWGLVVIVEDLEALAERLGEHLGAIKDAVQPGRHIATLRESAHLSQPVAFMDPGS